MQGTAGKLIITNPELSDDDKEREYRLRTAAAQSYAASIPSDELRDPDEGDNPDIAHAIIAEIVSIITGDRCGVYSMRLEQLCALLHSDANPTEIVAAAHSGSERLRRALIVNCPELFRGA
jgi:hypothetical protein